MLRHTAAVVSSLATLILALPAQADLAAEIARVNCEEFRSAITQELNQTRGTPFGKPYLDWQDADFKLLRQKVQTCADAIRARGGVREREAVAYERGNASLIDRYQGLQESARRSGEAKKVQAEKDAQRAKAADEQNQQRIAAGQAQRKKMEEAEQARKLKSLADQEAIRANVDALRARAAASYQTHRGDLERAGLNARLLDSTLVLPLYPTGMNSVIGVGLWLSLVLDNPNAQLLGAREWDVPAAKGTELQFKLPQRPSFGLLFKNEGTDTFLTHTVENDVATPVRLIDMSGIVEILGIVAGYKFQDFGQLYYHPLTPQKTGQALPQAEPKNVTGNPAPAETAGGDVPWAAYAGKHPRQMFEDAPVRRRAEAQIGNAYDDFLNGLSVAGDDVRIIDGRYLIGSGCAQGLCSVHESFFVIDTADGRIFSLLTKDGSGKVLSGRDMSAPKSVTSQISVWTSRFKQ